jgi:GDPmannose 4,6-dehydratase
VRIDPRYFRPTEVDQLLGDPSKAKQVLGWEHKTPFRQIVSEMVASDMRSFRGSNVLRRAVAE